MNAHSRQQQILALLESKGEVRVSELCQQFGVSEMTIRRDLAALDRAGLIRRTHGGAISGRGRSYEPPFLERANTNLNQKKRIAGLAITLIHDGESIALDVGTTTLEVAMALRQKALRNLTIITSSLHIANLLAEMPHIRLIVSGGILRPGEHSLIGHLAERTFREFYVDKLFLGVGGISLEAGLTEFNLEDALVKQAMLQNAKECIVLADSSKLNRIALNRIAPLHAIHTLITDAEADRDTLQRLQELGIRILLA
uniref:DeoR family transcriptional regulator n=1 Tax=uncultured Chloroflexota bacterium TaxID=166587 RepID=H5SID7_9CHLR|nr:DeoR family transcriptional regulator [uncultured Chloroflexota bacterium]